MSQFQGFTLKNEAGNFTFTSHLWYFFCFVVKMFIMEWNKGAEAWYKIHFLMRNYCCKEKETLEGGKLCKMSCFGFIFFSFAKCEQAEHSCQSCEQTVYLQEEITEEHKFIRVESHSNALKLNVRSEQTMRFRFPSIERQMLKLPPDEIKVIVHPI